jgi:hypothetical protein
MASHAVWSLWAMSGLRNYAQQRPGSELATLANAVTRKKSPPTDIPEITGERDAATQNARRFAGLLPSRAAAPSQPLRANGDPRPLRTPLLLHLGLALSS